MASHIDEDSKMPTSPLKIVGKILSFVLMLVSLGLTVAILIKPHILGQILEWILAYTSTLGGWNYVLAAGVSLIESIPFLNIAVPWQTVAIVVAWHVAQYDFLGVLFVVVLAMTIGDAIAYWLGYKHGSYMLAHFGPIFGMNDAVVDKVETLIEKMWNWAIFVSKWNPYTRWFLPFIVGTLRMNFREFMLYNMIGSLAFGTILVFLSKLFVGHYREVVPYVRRIGLGLIVLVGAWYWWKHGREWALPWLVDFADDGEEGAI
jgi:membrane-associated protein